MNTTDPVKVAILVSKETRTCQGNGCMKAFHAGSGAFERYAGNAELFEMAFDDGDLESRIALLLEHGVQAVHLSSCSRSNNCDYEAIAHRLAELHNGTLDVSDAPGGGARFTLALPLS